ncbi:MAG: S41 family peptidase [Flavobacteriaceae bacterium]
MRIFLLFTSILFFGYGNAQNKIKPKKLNEDFEYLITELKLQHQGLYKYTNKNQTDIKIDSIRNTLKTPQTKLKFYKTLRYVVGLTNEGHTSIELPKWTMIKLGFSKSFLPLTVKLCDDHLIITQNYGKDINGLKEGSKIISVNNKKVHEIFDKLYPLIPTDGFNETSKHEWIGGLNFSLLYRLVYGKEKKFELQIQEFGNDKIQTLTVPAVRFTKFKTKNEKLKSKYFDYDEFKFEQINDTIAYLSIPSFGNDDLDYEEFYQKNFKKIDSLNIKHLIIDIQANGGGTEGNENLLFSYLSNKVVQKYKQVTMLPKPYQKNKSKQGYIEDKWTFQNTIAKRGNFTLHSDYYSDLGYKKPQKELIYNRKIYVLISGKTFSGGAEFASLIKMTDRGIFIGEETGGTYEGNVSGYSEYIKLPNSKIEIKIPIVHFQINVSPEKKGHGVIPDYRVKQTWRDYLNGKNTKKFFAIKTIIE